MADRRFVVNDTLTSVYEVRDPTTGQLTDATTAIVVTDPAGSVLSPAPTPTHASLGTYLASWTGDAAGEWDWTWTATGAVEDTTDGAVYVWPAGSAVPWAPSRVTVAALVPTRTLNQAPALATDPTYVGTFTDTTIPTSVQVDGLIAQAIGWVTGSVGTVLPAFQALAEAAASMRTAGLVLTAYPLTEQGAPEGTAQRWLDQADAALKQLKTANDSAGGTGPGGVPAGVGAYSFPDPPTWAEGWLP